MKKTICALMTAALIPAIASADAPTVSDVTFSQSADRRVTITYKLDAPAIVTMGIQTNAGNDVWVDLPNSALTHFTGDCNMLVTNTTTANTVYWQPDKAWPGHKITTQSARAVVMAWATDSPPDYMVVDLYTGSKRFYVGAETVPLGVTSTVYKTTYMVFRRIHAAGIVWRMGASGVETGNNANNARLHLVSLSEDYYMAIYPITTMQLMAVSGGTWQHSGVTTDKEYCPAQAVAWNTIRGTSAEKGANWPNEEREHLVDDTSILGAYLRPKLKMDELDLPTEAQWEYACRAGSGSAIYNNHEITVPEGFDENLDKIAWFGGNSAAVYGTARAQPVGGKEPNAWGLYDMLGNCWEWTLDWYGTFPTDGGVTVDPVGAATGGGRVARGGSAIVPARYCRCAQRTYWSPSSTTDSTTGAGFRLVCPVDTAAAK